MSQWCNRYQGWRLLKGLSLSDAACGDWSSLRPAGDSHGHVDHCFGIFAFDDEHREKGWPLANVVAHANVAKRFNRYKLTLGKALRRCGSSWKVGRSSRYVFVCGLDLSHTDSTPGYNSVINSRQFGTPFQWPDTYRYPDTTYDVRKWRGRLMLGFVSSPREVTLAAVPPTPCRHR